MKTVYESTHRGFTLKLRKTLISVGDKDYENQGLPDRKIGQLVRHKHATLKAAGQKAKQICDAIATTARMLQAATISFSTEVLFALDILRVLSDWRRSTIALPC